MSDVRKILVDVDLLEELLHGYGEDMPPAKRIWFGSPCPDVDDLYQRIAEARRAP